MTPSKTSPYPLEWGALKLKSKRSLGKLRDRIVGVRSTNKSDANFDSISQAFYPYPSEAYDYHKQSFTESTASTIMTTIEPDSPSDTLKKTHGSETSSPGQSPEETCASSVYSEVDDQPEHMKPTQIEDRPESIMSQRLSVSLTSPLSEHSQTPDIQQYSDSSFHDLNQYSRSSITHTPDSPCSFMNHSTDNENSPQTPNDAFPNSTSSEIGSNLPSLQVRSFHDTEQLDPIWEDDTRSFELAPAESTEAKDSFSLECRAEQMFSRRHLEEIFADPSSMLDFTGFLSKYRPNSIPLLLYHLDALKALKAIKYANAISTSLIPIPGLGFTDVMIQNTANEALEQRARDSFDAIVRDDLPAYIAHVFIQIVGVTLRQRVTGVIPAHLREASEGLAEVFCLTDPARPDNPIVFASEEFHRTTQYGVEYAIDRNCRFLQGPNTSKDSGRRIKQALDQGVEINELCLNYRRDGSPFMNLLMVSPLYDSKGRIRYFIGAQVDVSGLCKDATSLESLKRLLDRMNSSTQNDTSDTDALNNSQEYFQVTSNEEDGVSDDQLDQSFQELSEMFSEAERDSTRHGGRFRHLGVNSQKSPAASTNGRAMLHVQGSKYEQRSVSATPSESIPRKRFNSLFPYYLLVRPYPSLRILFASDALRTPGILQSPFLSRIGGSSRVREELKATMAAGQGVTAKVLWVSGRAGESKGRARWVHCTPLFGKNGNVGVWMIVVVDEEGYKPVRRFKPAPPVAQDVRRASIGRGLLDKEKKDSEEDVEGEEAPAKPAAIPDLLVNDSVMT